MSNQFYIASCIFTEDFPELSRKVQQYIARRFEMPIIRCCVANYKVEEFEQRMPDWYRDQWRAIKHYDQFPSGSTMISICHNCSAIYEERHAEIERLSIWELILSDDQFVYPDLGGERITVQDCWRSKENRAEQDAVLSAATQTQCQARAQAFRRRRARFVPTAFGRREAAVDGRALFEIPNRSSVVLLPLLPARIETRGRRRRSSRSTAV